MEFSNREEYRKKFITAPADMQDLMSAADTFDTIVSIADKYNINKNNLGNLSYLVGEVMLDMIGLEKFKEELVARFKIGEGNAGLLTTEMQKGLFYKIENGEVKKKVDIADSLGRPSALPHKKQSVLTWFVSRERQDVADQLRGKLEKTERLIMLMRNFSGPANDPQHQAPPMANK